MRLIGNNPVCASNRIFCTYLLLARGRDRLETETFERLLDLRPQISYSLGDAIDWKLRSDRFDGIEIFVSYSLGDAINWKLVIFSHALWRCFNLLLARGCDRLETREHTGYCFEVLESPTR